MQSAVDKSQAPPVLIRRHLDTPSVNQTSFKSHMEIAGAHDWNNG